MRGGRGGFFTRAQQSAKKQSDGVAFSPLCAHGVRSKLAHCCGQRGLTAAAGCKRVISSLCCDLIIYIAAFCLFHTTKAWFNYVQCTWCAHWASGQVQRNNGGWDFVSRVATWKTSCVAFMIEPMRPQKMLPTTLYALCADSTCHERTCFLLPRSIINVTSFYALGQIKLFFQIHKIMIFNLIIYFLLSVLK